jgi:two-component system, chemotaxis family, sensor kinase CheA
MNLDISRNELTGSFLDDFYTECDEHLTAIRESLVVLEESIGRSLPHPGTVEKLFRSFHSFKGNSAIIGLRPAEELAHSAEDLLRELSKNKVTLTPEGLDLLMTSTQRLEQVVASHRENKPAPDVGPLVERLRSFSRKRPSDTAESTSAGGENTHQPALSDEIEAARARGLVILRFSFSPNRDLDQRGVNVNSVRARLGEVGEVLQAKPHIKVNGVVFEFIAALETTPSDISAWETDGVKVEPFETIAESSPGPDGSLSLEKKTVSEPEGSHGLFVAPSHVVRVDLGRLDELMRITGEMVIHRARLEDQVNRLSLNNPALDVRNLIETNGALGRDLRELRESIMRVRLVPVAEIFARMPFVVRDLARDTGKKFQLTFSGQATEIDKYVVERLKEPLLHLVRNSISHGIESPEERVAAGKPPQATLFLRASALGDTVMIELGDDGRGIDVDAVKLRATALGLSLPSVLNDVAILNLICTPGFSTRDEADRAAGRGVGMAVVQSVVRELGGTLSLETEPNRGVRFLLRLPLTLAIADVLIVSAQEQTCAVPQSFVQEILQMTTDQVRRIQETEVIPYQKGILPLIRLRAMFDLPFSAQTTLPVVVLNTERGRTGLVVDRIHGQREVVVRALRDPLIQVQGIAGATELGDGRPVLILDGAALTARVARPHETGTHQSSARPAAIPI